MEEDVELDSKYRSYAAQVEKVLKQFESPREWADLCSYLTKLKRILQSNSKYTVIPKKLLVAKRLSQCLHHALPSGVHLRTLDVYVTIFKRIGKDRLAQDLSIYSVGLFPLVRHAAMSVRPKLLEIFENYYIPLGRQLIPCLHGFILALLSGLEEGSEHFDSVTGLLGRVKLVTDRTIFYGSLWRALISDPSVRYQGSLYVLSQITRRKRVGQAILGDNRETLIQALCLGLEDTNTLTQRNFLDFVLFACPLNTSDFPRSEVLQLMRSALCVFLRRDMALNRRVYNWLEGHGAEESNERKRISMTSMELQAIVQSGEGEMGAVATAESMHSNLTELTELTEITSNGSVATAIEEPPPPELTTIERQEREEKEGGGGTSGEEGGESEEGRRSGPGGSSDEGVIRLYEKIYELEDVDTPTPVSTDPPSTITDVVNGLVEEEVEEEEQVVSPPGPDRGVIDTSLSMDELAAVRAQFFAQYGRPHMMTCLRDLLFAEVTEKTALMQPYRIINSLMDRADFGSAIIEDLLLDINRALYKNCVAQGVAISASGITQIKLHKSDASKELRNAANMLLNKFEPNLLWDWIAQQLAERARDPNGSDSSPLGEERDLSLGDDGERRLFTPSRESTFDELLSLTDFLLEIVSFEYNASVVQSTYLPRVLQGICENMRVHVRRMPVGELAHAIDTCSNLLSRAQPTTVDPSHFTGSPEPNNQDSSGEEEKGPRETTAEGSAPQQQLQMEEMSVDMSDEEREPRNGPSNSSQGFISQAIAVYQEFLAELLEQRVISSYSSSSSSVTSWPSTSPLATEEEISTCQDMATVFNPACALLLDFACFPIFCNSDGDSADPIQLTDFSFPGKDEESVVLPGWLSSLLQCCKLTKWHEVVLTSIRTLSILIGITLSIAEEQGAGRKALEGSVAVVLMPMLSEIQLRFIQSHTTCFSDIVRSLWGYLAARHATLHHRVVKLLWKLHHLAPSSDVTENVMGEMLASYNPAMRLEGMRRFTVFWHISASLSDNCKEWSKLQVSGKDLSRTVLSLLECLAGTDYQSRLLSKAWISQCYHYGDLNRILDPLLITLLHPTSARAVVRSREQGAPEEGGASTDDAHSLNRRTKLSLLSEEDSDNELFSYTGGNLGELSHTGTPAPGTDTPTLPLEERKRTDCQSELEYSLEYDTQRSKYLWQIILSMLMADPTPFIRSCYASKFNATSKYLSQEVYELFHKHRMSIRSELFNDPFFLSAASTAAASETDSRLSVADRLRKISKSYLELLVTVCLWYTRSRYRQGSLAREVFESNCEVRLVAVEFLTNLVQQCAVLPTELRKIVCDTLFERCHLQESVLYVLQRSIVAHTESSYIVREDHELLEWTKSFQSELIVLVQCILELEKVVGWGDLTAGPLSSYEFDHKYVDYYMNCQDTHIAKVSLVETEVETSNNPRYLPGVPLIAQPLFTHCVLVALTTRRVTFLHKKWLDTVISCLDYSSPLLRKLSEVVVQQVLHNTRQLAREYHNTTTPPPVVSCVPVNQTALLLEALSSVVHFILVHAPSAPNTANQASKTGFLEFFSFGGDVTGVGTSPELEHVNAAKHAMLQMVPRCVDTLLDVWIAWKMIDPERAEGLFPWGKPHDIKTLLLNFLAPLFKRYPASMLSSLCEVWHMNRRNLVFGRPGHLVSSASKRQLALIDLLLEVKVCTFDVLLKNSQKLLNTAASHPKDSREQFGFSFETELMHLSYEYFRHLKRQVMAKAWPHLLHLLREANTFTSQAPVTLLSLAFLHLYLANCPTTDDVKSRRELQEVTVKLVELTTEIASRSLSGHTWFGRRSEVVPEYKEVVSVRRGSDSDSEDSEGEEEEGYEGSNVHTLQAIYALAECLAPIIDLVYGSEEKDKAVTILSPLISKISVYIRNHAHHNMPNARASAALLTSITDYQYCRKAWAKEIYDAFLDPDFFVMEGSGVSQWRVIIEHLIAHDSLLFQDLLARVTSASGGLLGSSEAFYNQKARLIKRLTFTIFCCEYNQYAKFISKIQECFVEALKLTAAHQVVREVFLGFRVLILRMAPATFSPLWPIMLNELYGQLVELREFLRKQSDWEMAGKTLSMYLSISKLLDMALIVPAEMIPDFQVHHWSFVCDRPREEKSPRKEDPSFECLVSEISYVFDTALEDESWVRENGRPFLTQPHIRAIRELQPFFASLSSRGLFGSSEVSEVPESSTTISLIEDSLDQEYIDLV